VTQDEKYLRFIALVFLGLTLLTSFSNKIRGNLLASLTSKLSTKFTSLFLMHTLKLPFSYFEVRNVGDITTRLSELDKIRDFFSTKFVLTFVNLFSLFIYLFVLYLYAPILILVFLPFIPIFLVFLRYLMKKAILNLNNTFKAAGKMQSLTFEQIEGIETLKSLGALVATRWRWEESIVNLFKNRVEFEHISVLLNAVSKFFQEFVAFTLFITGIYLYFEGDLSLGQVIAINALGGSIVAPLIQLMQEWDEFNKIAVSIEKVDEIFTSPTESIDFLKEYKQNDKKLQGDIQFKNIFFQYGNEQSPMVLKGINLQINAGETIAFVGSSGSGKTTLAYMVNRLYNPTKGHVLVDGVDSAEIPLEDLRESMAMINQDNNIFSGTIIDNITLGDSKPDFNRVIEAAKLADAHDFIIGKKAGYYHQLGESGTGVSGGQKQRLNIARAFYKNPNILIMDEATSALDSKSEAHIMKNIKKRGDKTTLIIAHRLNTIIHADRIFVFHKGQLIEQGSHKELILAQKKYFQMFKKQLEMS
jgi:ATP-binding cassette subfamily B protein